MHTALCLYRWAWYSGWRVGALILFWVLWRVARKRGERPLARFALAVFAYGAFQLAVAMIISATPALIRLLRAADAYLQLVYFFMTLVPDAFGQYAAEGEHFGAGRPFWWSSMAVCC